MYNGKEQWQFYRRFSEFDAFDKKLRREVAENLPKSRVDQFLPTLPAKRVFGRRDAVFVASRRMLLERYLRVLIDIPDIAHLPSFDEFLEIRL